MKYLLLVMSLFTIGCSESITIDNQVCGNVSNFKVVPESDNKFKTFAENGRLKRPYDQIHHRLALTIEFKKLSRQKFDQYMAKLAKGTSFNVHFESGAILPFIFDSHTNTEFRPVNGYYRLGINAKSVYTYPSPFTNVALGRPIDKYCGGDISDPCCYDIQYTPTATALGDPVGTPFTKIPQINGKPCGDVEILEGVAGISLNKEGLGSHLSSEVEVNFTTQFARVPAGTYPVKVAIWNSCKSIEVTINVIVPAPPVLPKTIVYNSVASDPQTPETLINTNNTSIKEWIVEEPNGAPMSVQFKSEDITPVSMPQPSDLTVYAWTGSSYILWASWSSANFDIDTSVSPPTSGNNTFPHSKYKLVYEFNAFTPNMPNVEVDITATSTNAPLTESYSVTLVP